MATPSVLTVPSMYGDGILYSGPTVFGNQIITNGNFSQSGTVNATSWTLGWQSFDSGISISNGNLILARATSDCRAYATDGSSSTSVVTSGKRYKLTYTVTENSNNASLFYHTGAAYVSTSGGVGTHVAYYTAGGAIFILRNNTNNSTIKIDNISLKEITQGSDFDFTRGTTGTRINEEGYIEDVPYNLFSHSEDFSYGAYAKYQAGISETTTQSPISGYYVQSIYNTNTGTTYSFINQNLVTPDRQDPTTFSLYAKKSTFNRIGISNRSNDSFGVIYDLDNGTVINTYSGSGQILASSIRSAGNGFYLCSVTLDKSNQYNIHPIPNNISDAQLLLGTLSYTEIGSVNIFGAQVVKGDKPKNYLPTTDRVNLPRLNYPVYGGCPSLLVEPQRTNIFPYSNDYTQSNWSKASVTITEKAGISPENLNNASKMIVSANASFAYIYDSLTSSSSIHTISAFVKADGRNIVWLYIASGSSNGTIYFDLSDASMQVVAGSNATPTGTITSFPNDWYKITYTTGSAISFTGGSGVGISDAKGNGAVTVDGTNGVLIYGLQLEQGSYPTSLIPTGGAAVTRNEDIAADAGLGTTDTFNDSEGVFYVEIRSDDPEPTAVYTSINDGGGGQNQVRIGYLIGSLYSQIRVAGSAFYALNITEADVTQNNKVAVRYKAEDHAVFLNGFKLSTNTSNNIFAAGTLDRVNFSAFGTSGEFNGEAKAVAVYKTALTDTELANLTSYNNHDLFIPYRSRMQMISADQELQCTEHDITRFL